jgi:hypothetical protein
MCSNHIALHEKDAFIIDRRDVLSLSQEQDLPVTAIRSIF